MEQIFGKVPSGAIYLNIFGPAGGSRTRKGAFALQDNITWLVETEIAFPVEQQGGEKNLESFYSFQLDNTSFSIITVMGFCGFTM